MKKMNITSVLSLIGALVAFSTFAQQEAQFSNTVNNPYILNPAAGGLSDVMHLELTSRAQWLGYNGGPRTMLLSGNAPIKIGKRKKALDEFNAKDDVLFQSPERTTGQVKHVVGGKFSYEGIGPFARTALYGSYAIHLPFSKKVNVGIGLGLGWSNFGIREDRVVLYQEDDQSYAQFLGNTTSQNILDANAGITFYNDKLLVGISTTQLLKNKAVFADVATESNYNRHYFLTAKYAIELGDLFELEPTAVLKLAENSPFSGDFGTRFVYNKSSWFGVQYRTSNALIFQVGSNLIKNIYVSYAYEQSIGAIRTTGNGTHELQLGFYLGKNRNISKETKDKGK